MNTTKLTFDPTGWLEINYNQVDGEAVTTLQSTSYHPTQLDLIHADCATHGVTIEGTDAEAIAKWVAEYVPEPIPKPTIADFDAALTAHLDATAQAKRYDNRITCMVRAGFPGPFQAEAIAFATWCDTCNTVAYGLMAEVEAGNLPLPETTQALIALLPPMVWPA